MDASDSTSFSWTSDDDDAPPPLANTSAAASQSQEILSSSSLSFSDEQDDVESLLQSLPREQLVSLLLSSATRNLALRSQIRRLAEHNPANCRITVRNLPWKTTSQELRTFFSQYGQVKDCHVAIDSSSGLSKGFGFVNFLHPESAMQALHSPEKWIGGRVATCLLVTPHHTYNYEHVNNGCRKIYVARVDPEIDAERLYNFFSKYGEIEEGPIGFDKYTGKSRGYAMFVYKTDNGARKALEEPMKNFEGHLLQCQPGNISKVRSGFRQANCWLNSGAGPANGFDFMAPPPYGDQHGSW